MDQAIASGSAFAKFSTLPLELQLITWEHAFLMLDPRLVIVEVDVLYSQLQFSSKTPLPVLLQACKTTRWLGLKIYSTCIRSVNGVIKLDGGNETVLFFNPDVAPPDSVQADLQDTSRVILNTILGYPVPRSFPGIKTVICRGYQRRNFGYIRLSEFERFRDECLRRVFPDVEEFASVTEYGLPYENMTEILRSGEEVGWRRRVKMLINDRSTEREGIEVEGDVRYFQGEMELKKGVGEVDYVIER